MKKATVRVLIGDKQKRVSKSAITPVLSSAMCLRRPDEGPVPV